ncbi:hypothetical protein [Actinomadura oligospora]|uniref:hypothetical protein n=1 Tax=Actinomadura oligospora TaxID=111804 RepID=UPI00047D4FDB|nr:hypothetical protein [Actinomadura oligospora]
MRDGHVRAHRGIMIGAGAAVCAAALTACGGDSRPRDDHPAGMFATGTFQDGVNCSDPTGDVRTVVRPRAGRRAPTRPGYADMTSVSWKRTPSGASVVMSVSGSSPASGTAFETLYRQGANTTRVQAVQSDGKWTVTSGNRRQVPVPGATAAMTGSALTLTLPSSLPADGATVDLTRPAEVDADTRATVRGVGFTDEQCGSGTPRRTGGRRYLSWPAGPRYGRSAPPGSRYGSSPPVNRRPRPGSTPPKYTPPAYTPAPSRSAPSKTRSSSKPPRRR